MEGEANNDVPVHQDDTAMEIAKEKEDIDAVSSEEKIVCSFFLAGKCRFGDKCKNVHPVNASTPENKMKPHKQTVPCEELDVSKKEKPSLKTARDVINRILWDENLPEEYFTIGYKDRFIGLVEKPFTEFTWGDLGAMDFETFAIPQHRIQFFKYRGEKVWDRNDKLDIVFGSTGCEQTFPDFMTSVDEKLKVHQRATSVVSEDSDREDSANEDFDTDSDDDVDIGLPSGGVCVPNQKIFVAEEDRSTHFLAIKITSDSIRDTAIKIQEHIRSQEPILGDCCMNPSLMHVTLTMLRLEGPGIEAAYRSVKNMEQEVKKIVSEDEANIEIRGLDTFGQRVLYANVLPSPSFWGLVAALKSKLMSLGNGVKITSQFDFVPHMTILKVSRPVSAARRSKYIDPYLYMKFKDTDFGIQKINNVQLCVIESSTRDDGFYRTLLEIKL